MHRFPFLFFLIFLMAGSPAGLAAESSHTEESVLIMEGTAVDIRPLKPPATADAVEDVPDFRGLTRIVFFQVEKIIEGHLEEIPLRPHSAKNQLKEIFIKHPAVKQYDRRSKPEELNKIKFGVAVRDPQTIFRLSWRE